MPGATPHYTPEFKAEAVRLVRSATGDCGVLARQALCDLGPEQPLNIAADARTSRRTHRCPASHRRTPTLWSSHYTPPKSGVFLRPIEPAQYTALSFGKKLEKAGIVPSMSRVGSALDNAISESFVSTIKSEIGVNRYSTRQAARASVFEFIELFYNRVRRHSSLGYLSPFEYEQAILEEAVVA